MSGRPRGCPGVFGNHPGCPGGLPYVQKWSKGYLECMGMVRRPSPMSSGGRRPSRMSGSSRVALLHVPEG